MRTLLLLALLWACGIAAAAQSVRTINLPANDLYYDPGTARLYATIPGFAGNAANSVVSIDPATGKIGPHVWIGSEPGKIAATDDGHYLYIGLEGAYAISRFDLQTQRPDQQFSLGYDPIFGPYQPFALAAVPGQPQSVAATLQAAGGSWAVAIYDAGVARPSIQTNVAPIEGLAFPGSAANLYYTVFVNYVTPTEFVAPVTDQGLPRSAAAGLFDFFPTYDAASGLFYGAFGGVLDPAAGQVKGRFFATTNQNPQYYVWAVAPDTAHNVVYLVVSEDLQYTSPFLLVTADPETFMPTGSAPLAGLTVGSAGFVDSLRTCGDDRVAFRTANQIYVVHGLQLPAIAQFALNANAISAPGTVTATVTLRHPAPRGGVAFRPYALGNAANSITLSGPFTIPPGQRSGTFTVTLPSYASYSGLATLYAGYGVNQPTAELQVLDKAGDPIYAPGAIVLNLAANHLAANPWDGQLYASVPDSDLRYGNRVVRIHPRTGAITASFPVGSQPDALAVADGGQYLYLGSDGAGAVRRLDLATGTVDLDFALDPAFFGASAAAALAPLPGEPRSVGVERVSDVSDPNGTVVLVADEGVARPNATPPGLNIAGGLAPGAAATRLYTQSAPLAIVGFTRLAVDAAGVSVLDTTDNLLPGVEMKFDAGHVYSNTGAVVDPELRELVGTYPVPGEPFNYDTGTVAPAAEDNRAYLIGANFTSGVVLYEFDAARFTLRKQIPLPGLDSPPVDAVRAGKGVVAFHTNSHVVILHAD